MFNARPVVGGVFIKMLEDPAMWKKWSSRDKTLVTGWASIPVAPTVVPVVATSQATPATWSYITTKPAADWTTPGFDDSAWKKGEAPFGNIVNPRTNWDTSDIWIRRTVTLPTTPTSNLQLYMVHDEDADVYVNGVLAVSEAGYNTGYEAFPIEPAALALLKPGATVTLAAHVHQTTGGQGIDLGLVNVIPAAPGAK